MGRYEHELPGVRPEELRTLAPTLIGTAPAKAGVLSFVLDGQETCPPPHDP